MTQSIIRVVLVTLALLSIPLMAMQFTDSVKWSALDFVFMALLLISGGIGIEVTLKKVRRPVLRAIFSILIVVAILTIWVETAVGIFGTSLVGS